MKIILLGPPGAGKGTQAEFLSAHFNIPAISTGAMARDAVRDKTELGLKTMRYTKNGGLLPDEVVIDLIRERIGQDDCRNGFILDGFPRTLPQAQALDKIGIEIDKVLSLEVSDSDIIERLGGRRECVTCHSTYHIIYNKPKTPGVCDKCGGRLEPRADDKPETVKKRLLVYHALTEQLKAYYKESGKLVTAKGQEKVADTVREVFKALGVEI